MRLLYPPDVAGWEWGLSWAATANIPIRLQHANIMFWGEDANRPFAVFLAQNLKNRKLASSPDLIVQGFCEFMDVPQLPEVTSALVDLCQKNGGSSALDNKDQSANLFAKLAQAAFSVPAFQLM